MLYINQNTIVKKCKSYLTVKVLNKPDCKIIGYIFGIYVLCNAIYAISKKKPERKRRSKKIIYWVRGIRISNRDRDHNQQKQSRHMGSFLTHTNPRSQN